MALTAFDSRLGADQGRLVPKRTTAPSGDHVFVLGSVPIDSTVALELVDVGPSGVDRTATQVWLGELLVFDGGRSPELLPEYAGARSLVLQTADTLRIVLDPLAPFESQAEVGVRVKSRTADAAAALDETYRFFIEDRTAPRVVAAQATGPRTVVVSFDEPVMVAGAPSFELRVLAGPAVPVSAASAVAEAELVSITLDTEMTPDITYEARAVGISDLSGNPVLPPFDRVRFEGFRPAQPAARGFDLWLLLPRHNRRDDTTGDLERFIRCLQEPTDLLLAGADAFPDIFDLERAPEAFLDAILADLGNPFAFELDLVGRRRLASLLVEMYRQKGTAKGIKNAVRFFLGLETTIEAFASDTLALGDAELGVSWILGPSDRFALYAFNVVASRVLAPAERRQLRVIVDYLKPAHTHFIDLIEPSAPIEAEHWELGVSELGTETLLH